MNKELIEKAETYAVARSRKLGRRLGFGIHGIVFVFKSEGEPGETALKMHRESDPFERERDVYERLAGSGVTRVSGFHIPQLIHSDSQWLALEMTIVTPPWVLDFAGAYLDFRPEFSDEVWGDWEKRNQEAVRRRLAESSQHPQ